LKIAQTGQSGAASGAATAARCSGIAGTAGRPGAGANRTGGGSPLAYQSGLPVILTTVAY